MYPPSTLLRFPILEEEDDSETGVGSFGGAIFPFGQALCDAWFSLSEENEAEGEGEGECAWFTRRCGRAAGSGMALYKSSPSATALGGLEEGDDCGIFLCRKYLRLIRQIQISFTFRDSRFGEKRLLDRLGPRGNKEVRQWPRTEEASGRFFGDKGDALV